MASYVGENLTRGEVVYYSGKVSLWSLMPSI